MPEKVPLVPHLGGLLAVHPHVIAMPVRETIVRTMRGEVKRLACLAEGIDVEIAIFAVRRQMLPSAGESPAVKTTMISSDSTRSVMAGNSWLAL